MTSSKTSRRARKTTEAIVRTMVTVTMTLRSSIYGDSAYGPGKSLARFEEMGSIAMTKA